MKLGSEMDPAHLPHLHFRNYGVPSGVIDVAGVAKYDRLSLGYVLMSIVFSV